MICIPAAIGTAMSSPGQKGQEACTINLMQLFISLVTSNITPTARFLIFHPSIKKPLSKNA